MNNTYWQDESHCVNNTFIDTYITYELNEDLDDFMATRAGCKFWCEAQANYYRANCCVFALFGNEDASEFQSYCALYQITESQVIANPAPQGKGLTAFYSSNLMTDIELVFQIDLPDFLRDKQEGYEFELFDFIIADIDPTE